MHCPRGAPARDGYGLAPRYLHLCGQPSEGLSKRVAQRKLALVMLNSLFLEGVSARRWCATVPFALAALVACRSAPKDEPCMSAWNAMGGAQRATQQSFEIFHEQCRFAGYVAECTPGTIAYGDEADRVCPAPAKMVSCR